MRFEGCRTLLAPPEVVWSTLLDPGVLRTCIPGCQEVRLDGAEYHVRATLAMLFVRGTYQGRVRLVNPVRPHAFQLDADTAIGVVSTFVRLTGDSTTTLHYFCEAYLEGTLLRFGESLIRTIANRLLDQYFACLAARLATLRDGRSSLED
jgi:carbon monoxide dehydrogenase subunit G